MTLTSVKGVLAAVWLPGSRAVESLSGNQDPKRAPVMARREGVQTISGAAAPAVCMCELSWPGRPAQHPVWPPGMTAFPADSPGPGTMELTPAARTSGQRDVNNSFRRVRRARRPAPNTVAEATWCGN